VADALGGILSGPTVPTTVTTATVPDQVKEKVGSGRPSPYTWGPPPAGDGASLTAGRPDLALPEGDIAATLAHLQGKITETMNEINKADLKGNQDQQNALWQKRIKELQDAMDSMKNSSVWDTLGKVFGAIGAALSIVAGAALALTGVGAAAGAALIAVGTVMMVDQILQDTGTVKGGIAGAIADGLVKAGMDPSKAQWVAMAIYAAMMIVVAVGTGGAASAVVAGQAGTAAATTAVGETAVDAAATTGGEAAASAGGEAAASTGADSAAQGANSTARTIKIASAVGETVTNVGQAGMKVGEADDNYNAAQHQADAQKTFAQLQKALSDQDQIIEELRKVQEAYDSGMGVIMSILQSQNHAMDLVTGALGSV
jgi:hypothetical protein